MVWPKYKGLVEAKCEDHGSVELLDVNGYPWCPWCLECGPKIRIDGDGFRGPNLQFTPSQPLEYIQINFTLGPST